jgi:hypothetical protein
MQRYGMLIHLRPRLQAAGGSACHNVAWQR